MSNSRRYRRTLERRAIDTAMSVQGCACHYEVVHIGAGKVRIEHDDGCPMIGRRQILVALPKRCER